MPRKLKRNQLKHIKEALNQQIIEEVAEEVQIEEEKMSKDDIKKIFKDSAQPEEIKPSKKKRVTKIRQNLRKEKAIPQKTVAWQHEVGDLVHIPKKANRVDDDGYGIIISMSDPEIHGAETKMNDSRSLVFSPVGRSWYYTKNLRKV